MSKRQPFSFKAELDSILDTTGRPHLELWNDLEPADRDHLERWARDTDVEEIWTKIGIPSKMEIPPQQEGEVARFFIRDVLAARHLAEAIVEPPALAYHAHAEQAESLAKFLRGSGVLPPPIPSMPNYMQFVRSLEEVARMLRERAAASRMYVSPEDSDGSRQRGSFMRLMSDLMQSLSGRSFDEQVAALTDIAFPRPNVTTAMNVIDARRQPGRSRKRHSTTKRGQPGKR